MKATGAKKAKKSKSGPKRKAPASFFAIYKYKPALAEFMGKSEGPSQPVIKKIWDYIKKEKKQDGQKINLDATLKSALGTSSSKIEMTEIAKLVFKMMSKK